MAGLEQPVPAEKMEPFQALFATKEHPLGMQTCTYSPDENFRVQPNTFSDKSLPRIEGLVGPARLQQTRENWTRQVIDAQKLQFPSDVRRTAEISTPTIDLGGFGGTGKA